MASASEFDAVLYVNSLKTNSPPGNTPGGLHSLFQSLIKKCFFSYSELNSKIFSAFAHRFILQKRSNNEPFPVRFPEHVPLIPEP
jgi:hypothetical protein